MKQITFAGILIVVLTVSVFAQQGEKVGQGKTMGMSGSMMCPMMMGQGGGTMSMKMTGMMGDPVCQVLHKFGRPGFYTKHAEALGLSDEQVEKLDAIWFDHKKNAIRKKADLEIARLELKSILSQESVDFKKARAEISEIGSLEESLRLDCLQSVENVRNSLTPDQIKKLSELKKGCMKMMQGMDE